ncbi:forkhead box protein R1 [Cyprinodon tularosa]|uniref:forkhead box protein R1 n=1 Tax=Cyprinodon tularosa TaxID=77115 RepID=UPI0018E268BA|nr:forkhead box protein R1 [Cyprinodon tularosa]
MTFQLKTEAGFFDLHCSVGLTDWDMDKELKLATTTDQIYHDDITNDPYVAQRPSARASRRKDDFIWYDKTSDTFVKPNLWLLVNPNIACPLQYNHQSESVASASSRLPQLEPGEMQGPSTSEPRKCPHQEELMFSIPPTEYMIKEEEVSSRPTRTRRKGRITKVVDLKSLKPGCWPRPPVNYCILISLALKSSQTGSLKVQQIYNFTREHFPFFQTAPDGWKNTIRHNLCFSSSFRKTCNQLCKVGKRKSCFWHLTLDGQRRLQDEIHMLTGETLKMLERSMSKPDAIWSLLEQ